MKRVKRLMKHILEKAGYRIERLNALNDQPKLEGNSLLRGCLEPEVAAVPRLLLYRYRS